ncbi:MAG: heparinase II/III family protein [Planctomycetes bacterium]|nr:heparinase II/III family protein [Planctomycetota bacterium]
MITKASIPTEAPAVTIRGGVESPPARMRLAAAIVCGGWGMLLSPPVLAKLAAPDGELESARTLIALWSLAAALGLLAACSLTAVLAPKSRGQRVVSLGAVAGFAFATGGGLMLLATAAGFLAATTLWPPLWEIVLNVRGRELAARVAVPATGALLLTAALVAARGKGDVRLEPGRRRTARRRHRSAAALLALGCLIGFAAGGAARSVNHTDPLSRVAPGTALAARLADVETKQGRDAARRALIGHFRRRRSVALPPPEFCWSTGACGETRRARNLLRGLAAREVEIPWDVPSARATSFDLQRQTFLAAAVQDACGSLERGRLEDAAAWIATWRRANPVWPNFHPYAWRDDPTANRIQSQMLVMEQRRRRGLTSEAEEAAFLESVLQHADRLMDEEEHNYQTNHGLMQNCGLLAIAASYPEFDVGGRWRETAVRRMQRHLAETVAADGGFLEIAPGYHWSATKKCLWFLACSRRAGIKLPPVFERTVRGMVDACHGLLQPDGSLPIIADTDHRRRHGEAWPWETLPAWPELAELRAALESSNSPPGELGVRHWPESGYLVLRAAAPRWDADSALMLTLRAGPKSRAHLHYDALSLTLFAGGKPLLSGPGYLPYDTPRREQAIGTTEQNSVSVDGRSHRAGDSVWRFVKAIGAPDDSPDFVAACAESRLYDGVRHRRTVVYGPATGGIVVVDELSSAAEHVYRQHFRTDARLRASAAAGEAFVYDPSGKAAPLLLLKSWTWEGDRLAPAPGVVRGPVVDFVAGPRRDNLFVTRLAASSEAPQDAVQLAGRSLVWTGDRGRAVLALPIATADDCRWRPAGGADSPTSFP